MGEQPLFSCKAHVFQLEPELKKSWMPLSSTAVNVQIFHDPIKNIYRIVSIEGTKALINSIVTAKMTFTKTSQKFGQWIDFKLNFVYGLGFSNDAELNKFVDKFKEIKDLTRGNYRTHERSNSCEISSSMNRQLNESNEMGDKNENTLKYENERLKVALSHTTIISRKYEEEIQTLKSSNSCLNKALQETNMSLEEWKKKYKSTKEECSQLKTLNSSTTDNSIDDILSSSNSLNLNCTQIQTLKESPKGKKLKNELLKLSENFDYKLRELHEISDNFRRLINEIK